jgi:arginine deiminase
VLIEGEINIMNDKIHVFSEIGKLKTVLVHRPGDEVENLTPDLLERLLFDDIPFKEQAIKEHDTFTDLMRKEGVEVLYIEELVAQALNQNPDRRKSFIDQFVEEAEVKQEFVEKFKNYLTKMDNLTMVNKMIAGTKKIELGIKDPEGAKGYPFVADPLPNILFQRDPFASIGNGITMNHM